MIENNRGCSAIFTSVHKHCVEWRNARRIDYNERTQTEIEIQPVHRGSMSAAEMTLLMAELSKYFHKNAFRTTGIYTTATKSEVNRLLKKLGMEEKATPVSISRRARS